MEPQVLDAEHQVTFDHFSKLPFSEQAMAFLNVFWEEIGSQAEFIWMACETMKQSDMFTKGVQYIGEYEEGCDLDLVTGLYFYEKLYHFVNEDIKGREFGNKKEYKISMPEMMTANDRRAALRVIDINFDDRISFLEYLLDQYKDHGTANEFADRAAKLMDSASPELRDARKALAELNEEVVKFERAKRKLKDEIRKAQDEQKVAKEKQKKFEMKNLKSTFQAQGFNAALLKAQATVRRVTKTSKAPDAKNAPVGTHWWLDRELQEKKKLYGDHKGLGQKKKPAPKFKKNRGDSWISA